ncbi:MAG TPA: TonB-dependent receptor [Polyangiaceae bacterium]|nr:TonB-dependent receptor [Polyangiaceae bacterium]
MMVRIVRGVCVFWLFALLFCVPAPAWADDLADEADLQFQLGTEAYTRGDYRAALEHFLRSNGLVKNRNVTFNIARCYEHLAQYPNAWRNYSRALEPAEDPAFSTKVNEALGRIAPFVGVIEVTSEPPGATLYVDRKDLGPRGEAPLSLGLAPGQYKVLIELDGYEPASAGPVTVGAGEHKKLAIALKSILGQVSVQGTPSAAIRIGNEEGAVVGRVPATIPLRPGLQHLYVSAPGKKTREIPVDVRERATVQVRAELESKMGSLVVATDLRDALIEVDGRSVGFSPAVVNVPVGPHRVRVSLSGFKAIERSVVIAEGVQTRFEAELARGEQVTAASRTSERVEEAPSSVTILSREELRAMGYQTIAEAVRGVRGLYLTDDRSYTTIGIRGFSRPGDYGNKILILYDGHPYNENLLGQSFPGLEGRSDLDDVERIEIVRGPGSVVYGTGAFFGVINLVTHDKGEPTRAEFGAASHEHGVTRGRAFGYWNFGEGQVWTSASVFQGFGRDFYFPEYRDDESGLAGNARGIDGVKGGTVQGRVWWRDLTLQWFWHRREKELPTGEYDVLFGDPRNVFKDTRAFLELRFEPKLAGGIEVFSRAHANLYTFESTAPYAEEDGGLVEEEYQGRWIGFEQRISYSPNPGLRLTLGGELQRHFRASMFGADETGDVYLPGDDNPYWVVGVYTVGDIDVTPWLRVSAGVRFDAFQWEFSERDVTSSSIDPRLALIVRPYPAGVTKLIAGKAFRAPSIYERFYQSSVQTTSLDLDPEHVLTAEIEHTHRFSNNVTGVSAVFVNSVTDLVVGRGEGTETAPLFFVNSPTPVLTVGAELELRREWREGWMLAGNYALQSSEYVDPGAEDDLIDDAHVPNSPAHLASLKGAAPIIGRSLALMTRLTYGSQRYDRNELRGLPAQDTTSGSVVWDLVFNGRILDDRVTYNLGVYNLADFRHSAPVSAEFRMTRVPQNGRTLLAALNLTL